MLVLKHIKEILKYRVNKTIFKSDDKSYEFGGHSYVKFKFNTKLSDYQCTLVLKIIEYVKDFCVTADDLKTYWKKYNIPMPIKSDFDEILNDIQNHSYICLQDFNVKLYIDYYNHRHYTPSLMLNEFIYSMDSAIAEYQNSIVKDVDAIEKLSQLLSQNIILINSNIFQYQIGNKFEVGQNPCIEECASFYPIHDFFKDAKSLHDGVKSVINYINFSPGKTDVMNIVALNAFLLFEKHICAFSALCGLMLDASAGTKNYFKPLRCIQSHIRIIFHDSELYRLEFPASNVNISVPLKSRGPKDHTTIMKLYLIDQNDKRIIVRIDLPHVRSPKFHFNVDSPDTDRYSSLNHTEIESEKHDDDLLNVLEILKDSIKNQMSHMYLIQDTNNKDEKQILEDMEKLITYRHMCLNYIMGDDYSKELKKVSGYLKNKGINVDTNIDHVLRESATHFKI